MSNTACSKQTTLLPLPSLHLLPEELSSGTLWEWEVPWAFAALSVRSCHHPQPSLAQAKLLLVLSCLRSGAASCECSAAPRMSECCLHSSWFSEEPKVLYKSSVSISPTWQTGTTEAQRSSVICPSSQGAKDRVKDPSFLFSSLISEPGISIRSAAHHWKAEERPFWFLMGRPKRGWRRKLKLCSKQDNVILPFLSILTFMERTACLLHSSRSVRA